jgi:hypothetical protein
MAGAAPVVSANLLRRHLTPSQKAAIAADLLPQFRKEAKERQAKGGERGKEGGRGNKKNPPAKVDGTVSPKKSSGEARTIAAKSVGVSAGYVGEAEMVKKKDPELFEAVKRGEVSLSTASKRVDPTPTEAVQRARTPHTSAATHSELRVSRLR